MLRLNGAVRRAILPLTRHDGAMRAGEEIRYAKGPLQPGMEFTCAGAPRARGVCAPDRPAFPTGLQSTLFLAAVEPQ
jgi:hypothetical protein